MKKPKRVNSSQSIVPFIISNNDVRSKLVNSKKSHAASKITREMTMKFYK